MTVKDVFSRIKDINCQYPMLNEGTEEKCEYVKESEEKIESSAWIKDSETIGWKKEANLKGLRVENMKPHILSDLCLIMNEKSIPTLKECHHKEK